MSCYTLSRAISALNYKECPGNSNQVPDNIPKYCLLEYLRPVVQIEPSKMFRLWYLFATLVSPYVTGSVYKTCS